MIKEKDIRQVYKIIYKIAERVGSSTYTERLVPLLRSMFTNTGPVDTEKMRKVCVLACEIDAEYYKKLRNLILHQKTLEAKVK